MASFNWGPWAGGMVTDALKPVFEQEGLSLIPLDAGARLVAEEARRRDKPWSRARGCCRAAPGRSVCSSRTRRNRCAPRPMAKKSGSRWFQRDVDLESFPVLSAHVIDGHPVLPVVMILEWMAEAALHRNPGLAVCGVDDFRLFKGVILGHQKPARVELRAGKPVRRGGQFAVPVELSGTLANGKEVAHAHSVIVLGDRLESSSPRLLEQDLPAYTLSREEIYQTVLFHGPLLQGIESVEGCGERGVAGWVSTSPSISDWVDRPLRSKWLLDPLAIDSAFQLVGLSATGEPGRQFPTHRNRRPADLSE